MYSLIGFGLNWIKEPPLWAVLIKQKKNLKYLSYIFLLLQLAYASFGFAKKMFHCF